MASRSSSVIGEELEQPEAAAKTSAAAGRTAAPRVSVVRTDGRPGHARDVFGRRLVGSLASRTDASHQPLRQHALDVAATR